MSGAPSYTDVERALAALRGRIDAACRRAGRDPAGVTIVAVTKGFGAAAIEAALAAGLRDIGENYVQEALAKFRQVAWPAGARRHFIGRLQRNKLRRIGEAFDVVQSVCDLPLAEALAAAAGAVGKTLDVFIQVNVNRDGRQGVAPEDLAAVAAGVAALPHLRLRGLMAVGPRRPEETERSFAAVGALFADLAARQPQVAVLSMGMSGDLETALAHGATMLRIGSALFGPRPSA